MEISVAKIYSDLLVASQEYEYKPFIWRHMVMFKELQEVQRSRVGNWHMQDAHAG